MVFDVFISYPHQNETTAHAACAKLEGEGVRCWIAPRDIAPSADWAASIVEAIGNCHVMVLIFSEHANVSKQVLREVQQAFDAGKPVLPFRVENTAPAGGLSYYMGSVHWLDALTPPVEAHLTRLVAAAKALIRAERTDGKVEPLSRQDEDKMTRVLADLESSDESRWKVAAETLGELGLRDAKYLPELHTLLLRAYSEPDPVWLAAAGALAKMGSAALPYLLDLLEAGNIRGRCQRKLVEVLGNIKPFTAEAVDCLFTLADKFHFDTADLAQTIIKEKIGKEDTAAIPSLVSFLRSDDETVCDLAMQALTNIGAAAIPALREAKRASYHPMEQHKAALALEKIRGGFPQVLTDSDDLLSIRDIFRICSDDSKD